MKYLNRTFLRKFAVLRWVYGLMTLWRKNVIQFHKRIKTTLAMNQFRIVFEPRKNSQEYTAPFLERYSVIDNEAIFNGLRETFFTDQDSRAGWIGAGIPKTNLPDGQDLAKMASEHLAMYISCLPFMDANRSDQFNLLDVGCGFGSVTLCLADMWPNASVVGIDYDPIAINFAKRMNGQESIEYIASDFLQYKTDKQFEYIFMVDVLEHIPAELHFTFIDRCLSLLTPGGRFFLITPNAVHEEDGDHAHIGLLNAERMPKFIERYKQNFIQESYIVDDKLNTLDPKQFVVNGSLTNFEDFQDINRHNYSFHIRVVMTR